MNMKIYLASKSPRRHELLKQIGIDFDVININIDEFWDGKEDPKDYTCRVAKEKARAGKNKMNDDIPVLASDTAVILNGEILGKAETQTDARLMLEKLSGKTHDVLSSVVLITDKEQSLLSISKVTFRQLTKDDINNYCESDEPLGKAGGYAIQGKGAIFIERLEGSYSGVMGLPLYETQQLLNNYIATDLKQ